MNVHPMSVIVGIIAVFIIWTFFVILFGSFMMKNPYTHEKADQTTEPSRYHSSYSGYVNRYVIINSSVVEVPSVEQNDWSNIVTSISDDQSDWQEENRTGRRRRRCS